MKNTIEIESKRYYYLRQTMVVLMIFAFMGIAMTALIMGIINTNYTGQTRTVTGKITGVATEDDSTYVTLEGGEKYNANPVASHADLSALTDKTVTLYLPLKQFGGGTPLVLGVECDGATVVDAKETCDRLYSTNKTVAIVFGSVGGVCALATCIIAILRANMKQTSQTVPLGEALAHAYAIRQPIAKNKRANVALIIYLVLFLLVGATASALTETENTALIIAACCVVAVMVAGLAVWLPLQLKHNAKKNREMYALQFPFDGADVSHLQMSKKLRRQVTEELQSQLSANPHDYTEAGNGLNVRFGQIGVTLFTDDDTTPSAEQVFGDAIAPHDVVAEIPYEQLRLSAEAYYNIQGRPLVVVIRSNITERYPQLENDLFVPFDSNLYTTLQTFGVTVNGLEEILQNKESLMEQHAKDKHRKIM